MKYFLSPLFKRVIKKLDPRKKEEIKRAISELTAFFDSGIRSEGLGLKRMHGNIWEIRASLEDRILFSFEKDEIFFLIAGNHDAIKNFLKNR
jgi:mRNA-degrading endonuclease RelE of RelBE toxin-antitoxin system